MIMTFAELETSLIAVQTQPPNYTVKAFDAFTNLYKTGCRPTELLHLDQWERSSATTFTLLPSKNNNPRTIQEIDMTALLVYRIENDPMRDYMWGYQSLLYLFSKFYTYSSVTRGNRSIDLYLFRHHYVKKLFNDGMTITNITAHMGWINPQMAVNYVDSVIEYP